MRLPSQYQANAFFAPLRYKTSTFVINEREQNASLGRFILGFLSATNHSALILDFNSFYATNILRLTEESYDLGNTIIRIPGDSKIENFLIDATLTKSEVIIIDDLNTMHHFLSPDNPKSSSRMFQFILKTLSYLNRTNKTSTFLTLYKGTKRPPDSSLTAPRSLSRVSDLLLTVESDASSIRFKCERGKAWVSNSFYARI